MLTRSGLGAAIAALLLAFCGWWWRYEELVVAAAGITVLLLVAVWSAHSAIGATVTRRVAAPRVARGDPIRAVYRVVNQHRRRLPPVTLIDRCGAAQVSVPVNAIDADDRTEVVGLVPTTRRGVFTLGPWAIERLDPFGLAIGRRVGEVTSSVIVHPKIYSLRGPHGSTHTIEDDAAVRSAASDPLSGFVSLREYVDGDDPRLIHWPTSARMGTLMLREHVELRRPEFTVVLDAVDGVSDADSFEEMVDIAASVAVHALASGVRVRLRTTSRVVPGSSRPLELDTQVLDLLTPVQRCDAADSMTLAEVFFGGVDHSTIVFITGADGPSTTLANTDKLSVVRVGPAATSGPGIAMVVTDARDFVQRWRP